jgi:hypothetical protein
MNAEEYLVDRIQRLEKENAFLKSSNERKLVELQDRSKTIIAFSKIVEGIMNESDLVIRDLERHCDVGIAKIKIKGIDLTFHGDMVCEILQEAYNITHTVKDCGPWEPPTSDPEFFKNTHDGMSYDEYIRNKAIIVQKRKEDKQK